MPYAGQQWTPRLVVPGADGTTRAAVRTIDPAGNAADHAAVVADPADPTGFAGDPITLTAGVWTLQWAIAGTGADTVTDPIQTIGVAPDPLTPPTGFSYASTADLASYSGQAPDPDAARQLIDASREIDRLTITARYETNPVTGLAVDPRIRQALTEATCELAGWWAETGMSTGARALFQSASIAGVSVGLNTSATGGGDPRIGPRVLAILGNAGLLRGAIYG